MKCAVIEIVIALIISGVCLSTGDIGTELAITDGPSTKIQSCVAKIIEHILSPSESLVFVISSHPDYIPSRLPNPVTVIDIRSPLPTHYNRYEVNYVIEVESWELFVQAIDTIRKYPLWHHNESPKGKFVILIKEENALQNIFSAMWRHLLILHTIVVIYEETSKNCPMKVITSNPQAEGNNCGEMAKVYSNFSCDNISLELLKPIRNYNGCPVFIRPSRLTYKFNLNKRRERIMYNLLAGLKRRLNVTPIFRFADHRGNHYRHTDIVISEWFFGAPTQDESSIIFSRNMFIWTGNPDPTRISPLNTIFLPFKYDLWIGVLFITILMILIKWLIMKGNRYNNNYNNLACAFTDIIGLTFGVCVNRIPNIWSLKLLLGFFLVYVIHIHTAYTSDLINILTVPRYEGLIRNVEEVADRGIPIYMHDYHANNYFNIFIDDGSLLGKINKLKRILHQPSRPQKVFGPIVNVTTMFMVHDEDDLFISILTSECRFNSRLLRKTTRNTFLTTDISGEMKQIFCLRKGSYFTESLNAVITDLWESGTQEADGNLNPSSYDVIMKEPDTVAQTEYDASILVKNKIVRSLNLKDLLPIFVILLICYSFCIIIFVAEIFVHKIVAHITRNQVVPLNV